MANKTITTIIIAMIEAGIPQNGFGSTVGSEFT
jgi:hypothetical protein